MIKNIIRDMPILSGFLIIASTVQFAWLIFTAGSLLLTELTTIKAKSNSTYDADNGYYGGDQESIFDKTPAKKIAWNECKKYAIHGNAVLTFEEKLDQCKLLYSELLASLTIKYDAEKIEVDRQKKLLNDKIKKTIETTQNKPIGDDQEIGKNLHLRLLP